MQADLPEKMTLTSSRWKYGKFFPLVLGFTLLCIWMISIDEGRIAVWIVAGFGIVGTPLFLIELIRPGRLELRPHGFEQVMMGRSLKYRWQEVSEFGVFRMHKSDFVGFARNSDDSKIMPDISKSMGYAYGKFLAGNFGMTAEELTMTMNAFRHRALED